MHFHHYILSTLLLTLLTTLTLADSDYHKSCTRSDYRWDNKNMFLFSECANSNGVKRHSEINLNWCLANANGALVARNG